MFFVEYSDNYKENKNIVIIFPTIGMFLFEFNLATL